MGSVRIRRSTVVMALMLVLVMFAPASRAAATLPGENGDLLVYGHGPSGEGLYQANVSTGDVDRLPVDVSELGDLAWSPDGTQVVLTQMKPGERSARDVWIMNSDGSDLRLFAEATPDDSLEYVTWSPDGSQIAVSANRTCQDETCTRGEFLLMYDLAGEMVSEHDLDLIPYTINDLEWSPAGGELLLGLFWYPADGVQNVGTYELSTGEVAVLAGGSTPSWSPDGSQIAFTHFEGEDPSDTVATAVMGADGSGLREYPSLTGTWGNQGAAVGRPEWSPDGTRIALMIGSTGSEALHTMDPDGTEYRSHPLDMTSVASMWWQPVRPTSGFLDVPDDHLYTADIAWMRLAGITRGCDPPLSRLFCPDRSVSRGEMAAFLVRALDLPDALGNRFLDDEGLVFESDIEKLAEAGITRGCNPPVNDMFCPDQPITRKQMAALLHRARGQENAP